MPTYPAGKLLCPGVAFAGSEGRHAQTMLVKHRGFPTKSPLLDRRESIVAHAALRQARQLLGKTKRRRQCLTRLDDPVYEADALSFFARDAAASENEVHCPAMPDQSGQAQCAEVDQRHAETPAIYPEGCVASGHTEIAPQGEFETAGNGRTLDCGDHRLRKFQSSRPYRPVACLGIGLALTGSPRLQVGTRAKRIACTNQNGHAMLRFCVESPERVGQRLARRL